MIISVGVAIWTRVLDRDVIIRVSEECNGLSSLSSCLFRLWYCYPVKGCEEFPVAPFVKEVCSVDDYCAGDGFRFDELSGG